MGFRPVGRSQESLERDFLSVLVEIRQAQSFKVQIARKGFAICIKQVAVFCVEAQLEFLAGFDRR